MVTLWVGDGPGYKLFTAPTWTLLTTNLINIVVHMMLNTGSHGLVWGKEKKVNSSFMKESQFWAQPLRIISIWIKRERDWEMVVQTACTLAVTVHKPVKKHCSWKPLLLPLTATWPLVHAQGLVSSPANASNNNKNSCGYEDSVKWCIESSYFDAFEGLSGYELLL